jgi:phospholipase C
MPVRLAILAIVAGAVLVACGGDSPSPRQTTQTSASPTPSFEIGSPDADIPIDHIIVLMQENRSFDHYFGELRTYDPTLDVEAAPPDASNPDPANPGGPTIPRFHQTQLCETADLDHSWNGAHEQWNNGAMDGFTKTNGGPGDPTGSRTMGYYDETDLPFYYALYSTFAIGDRYFSSIMGPTQPNRFYLYAGTSFGRTVNGLPPSGSEFSQPSLFNLLDQAGVSWKVYSSQIAYVNFFAYVRSHSAGRVSTIAQYYTDAAQGQLPQVAFIDPVFGGARDVESDEHPPANVQVGQKFVADVIKALFQSPNWPSSALFLTYDEHGGYYDHVPPPEAVPPDSLRPSGASGAFDRYGIRVPFATVSPFAKQHFVSHTMYDHTSILRFIETRFGLPPLGARDAVADPMLDLFDLRSPPFLTPPALPDAIVDQSRLCG